MTKLAEIMRLESHFEFFTVPLNLNLKVANENLHSRPLSFWKDTFA